jgi:hypothetical protein
MSEGPSWSKSTRYALWSVCLDAARAPELQSLEIWHRASLLSRDYPPQHEIRARLVKEELFALLCIWRPLRLLAERSTKLLLAGPLAFLAAGLLRS